MCVVSVYGKGEIDGLVRHGMVTVSCDAERLEVQTTECVVWVTECFIECLGRRRESE